MVSIQKILLKHGVFSKDIKVKIKNEQLKLNGETITDSHMELDIEYDEDNKDFKFQELGDFLFTILIKGGRCRKLLLASWEAGIDIDSLSETNIDNNLIDVLKKVYILRISKREAIVLIKKLKKKNLLDQIKSLISRLKKCIYRKFKR